MAETSVENRICNACGAEVRPQSLYCYNCGLSVAPEIALETDEKQAGKVEDLHKSLDENNGHQTEKLKSTVLEDAVDQPIPKPAINEEPPLKSAATMRRKPKAIQPKKIEIVWEEHENAPNGWFIFAAILLTVFAAGVLYLALYLK